MISPTEICEADSGFWASIDGKFYGPYPTLVMVNWALAQRAAILRIDQRRRRSVRGRIAAAYSMIQSFIRPDTLLKS